MSVKVNLTSKSQLGYCALEMCLPDESLAGYFFTYIEVSDTLLLAAEHVI